jgi:serine O-acetyltransferase
MEGGSQSCLIADRVPAMTLQFEPSQEEFEKFLGLQLGLVGVEPDRVSEEIATVYPVVERQFGCTRSKYFTKNGMPILRVAHNAQYTIFLYCLSRALFLKNRRSEADRVYALLRMVSGIDLYYEVVLPERWTCDHPLGSVIGRGRFEPESSFVFTQNCNIGNNKGIYPKIAGNLIMFPNSSLLGDTRLSGNVILANGAFVIDGGELSDCLIYGRSPDLTIKPLSSERFYELSPLTRLAAN